MKKFIVKTFKKKFIKKYAKSLIDLFPNAKRGIENLQMGIQLSEKNEFIKSRILLDDASYELTKELPENHQVIGLSYNNLAECMRKIPNNQLQTNNKFHYNNIKELYENVINIWSTEENQKSAEVIYCLGK